MLAKGIIKPSKTNLKLQVFAKLLQQWKLIETWMISLILHTKLNFLNFFFKCIRPHVRCFVVNTRTRRLHEAFQLCLGIRQYNRTHELEDFGGYEHHKMAVLTFQSLTLFHNRSIRFQH